MNEDKCKKCIVLENCNNKKECFKEVKEFQHIINKNTCPSCGAEKMDIFSGSMGRGSIICHLNCHKCEHIFIADIMEGDIMFRVLPHTNTEEEYSSYCDKMLNRKPKKYLVEGIKLAYRMGR